MPETPAAPQSVSGASPETEPVAEAGGTPETEGRAALADTPAPEASSASDGATAPGEPAAPAASPATHVAGAPAASPATAAPPATTSPAPAPPSPVQPGGPSGPADPPGAGEDEDEDEGNGAGGKMSFLEHLDELRRRLITSLASLFVGFLICFAFIRPIFDFIMEPLEAVLEEDASLIYTSAPEYFFLDLKMAALAGLLLATPVVMSQFWLFIAPGLYAHEKKFAIPFVAFASVFFISGTLFGHYILFRVAWGFFAGYGAESEYVTFMPRLQDAFGLYVRLVLACGVIFQLPTIVFFLARMGVASPRFLIRNFKYAFLLCFVFAAILTPTPDPVTMTVMAGPMLALYVLSIGIAWVFRKRGTEEA